MKGLNPEIDALLREFEKECDNKYGKGIRPYSGWGGIFGRWTRTRKCYKKNWGRDICGMPPCRGMYANICLARSKNQLKQLWIKW